MSNSIQEYLLQGQKEYDLLLIYCNEDYKLASTFCEWLEPSKTGSEAKKRTYKCCHSLDNCEPGEIKMDW